MMVRFVLYEDQLAKLLQQLPKNILIMLLPFTGKRFCSSFYNYGINGHEALHHF